MLEARGRDVDQLQFVFDVALLRLGRQQLQVRAVAAEPSAARPARAAFPGGSRAVGVLESAGGGRVSRAAGWKAPARHIWEDLQQRLSRPRDISSTRGRKNRLIVHKYVCFIQCRILSVAQSGGVSLL